MQAEMEEAAEFHEVERAVRDERIRELESQLNALQLRNEELQVCSTIMCDPSDV